MLLLRQPIHERTPLFDAVTLDAQQIDVGSRAQETILQILAESVVDREGDDQRCDSRSNPGDGNAGNDADESLPSFRAKVAGCDKEFKSHPEVPRCARDFGARLKRRANASTCRRFARR